MTTTRRRTSEQEELAAERAAARKKPAAKKAVRKGPTAAEKRRSLERADPVIRAHKREAAAEHDLLWNSKVTEHSKVIRIYKHAGYLINTKALTQDHLDSLKEKFTYSLYDEKACGKCEFLDDRHGENCDNCPSFQGHRVLVKPVQMGEETLVSLPYGATEKVQKFLNKTGKTFKVIDRHPKDRPLSRRIRLADGFALRPYQREAVDTIKVKFKGVIEAPPRSGKTFLSAAAISELNQKTIILASQRDWLVQFRETFVGSETAPAMTTCKPHQVKFCRTLKDFIETDICLATPQQFMNPEGRKLLEQIRSLFPVMVLDECHYGTALATSRVLAAFNATWRWGLSGTPERKQAILMNIVFDLLGPIIYQAKVDRLKPSIELLPTGAKLKDPKGGHAAFASFVNRLELNEVRVKALLERIKTALKEKHMILIPCMRVKTVHMLVKAINQMAADEFNFKRPPADVFVGGMHKTKREQVIADARSYRVKVLVGNIRLLSTGLNIPRASMLIEYTLSSNRPNAIQRVARILTPMENKPQPSVVFMLDDSSIMRSTRRNEWWQAIWPEFKPVVSKKTFNDLTDWLKGNEVTPTTKIGRYDL